MEAFWAELINDARAPKIARYGITVFAGAFILFVGAALALKSPMTAGRIFGTAVLLACVIYLIIRIKKSGAGDKR